MIEISDKLSKLLIILGIIFILFMIIAPIYNFNKICEDNHMEYNYAHGCIKEVGNNFVEVYEIELTNEFLKFKLNKYPSIPN